MGNRTSSTGKVILSNGAVQEFSEPLTVAELMLEHPHHVMVAFGKSLASLKTCLKKPSPLPADTWLDTKNVYLMVPVWKGKVSMGVTVSAKEVHRLVTRATSSCMIKKLKVCTLFPKAIILSYVSTSGKICSFLRKDCVEECLLRRRSYPSEAENREEMREYYYSQQVSGRGWRPSLDTIVEKKVDRKVRHWLY